MFRIADKDGNDVDFILNSAQRQLDENLSGRDIIPKARQEGVSSYYLGRYTAKCLMKRNTKAVIISHEELATQRLLKRCRYFIENIRGPAPVVENLSKHEITFPKMNSMLYIGTAGSKKFGRGDTITDLHCSEYAFWPNAEDLLSTLMDCVPLSGEIGIESTGNGMNDYYDRCIRAYEGNSTFKCHFLPWHTFLEYCLDLTAKEEKQVMDGLVKEWEEPDLVKNFNLTAGQIAWRRHKLEEKNFDLGKFKQEYPMTLIECFQSSGTGLFNKINYNSNEHLWVNQGNHLFTWDNHPRRGMRYVVGVDPAGGVGKDNSVIQVICIDTFEQVAEYANNKIQPDVLGDRVNDIARLFNEAFVVVESNNHGPVTLKQLSLIYPIGKLFAGASPGTTVEDRSLMQLGYRTTARSKPLLLAILRTMITQGLIIHGPITKGELDTFVETATGKMQADEGKKDDRVMALAMACRGFNDAAVFSGNGEDMYISPGGYRDPFLLESILDEMHKGRGTFPIRPQHKFGPS